MSLRAARKRKFAAAVTYVTGPDAASAVWCSQSTPGMEDTVMAWTTDARWIAAHSTLAIVFILACAYIPA
jgi:hypothetical protein